MFTGFFYWDIGGIEKVKSHTVPQQIMDRFQPHSVYRVRERRGPSKNQSSRSGIAHYLCGYQRTRGGVSGRAWCECVYWSQTGTTCRHLYAMYMQEWNGPVEEFQENVHVVRARLKSRSQRGKGERPSRKQEGCRALGCKEPAGSIDCEIFHKVDPEYCPASDTLIDPSKDMTIINPFASSRLEPREAETRDSKSFKVAGLFVNNTVLSDDSESNDMSGAIHSSGVSRLAEPRSSFVSESDQAETAGESSAFVRANSLAGRPKHVEVLNRYRTSCSKRSESTLKSSQGKKASKKRVRAGRGGVTGGLSRLPFVGANNSGSDCFALVTFHCLVRLPAFREGLTALAESDDPICRVLRDFACATDAGTVKGYPDLLRLLQGEYETSLRDRQLNIESCLHFSSLSDPRNFQGDPSELFNLLVPYFERLSSQSPFGVFRHRGAIVTTCHTCGRSTSTAASYFSSLYLDNDCLRSGSEGLRRAILLSIIDSAGGIPKTATCGFASCVSVLWKTTVQGHFGVIGQYLGLNLTHNGRFGKRMREVDTPERLAIPEKIELGEDSSGSKEGLIAWALTAIICRIGVTTDRGHYVCYIKHSEHWYLLDDSYCGLIATTLTNEVFSNGKYPTRFVFERVSASSSSKPAPTTDKGHGSQGAQSTEDV